VDQSPILSVIGIIVSSAVVSAAVSSVFTFSAQHFDRKARQRELLLKAALELAEWRLSTVLKAAELQKGEAILADKLVLTETYYEFLEHLLKHGKLPKDDPRIERTLTSWTKTPSK
jgi:hypothetical protein